MATKEKKKMVPARIAFALKPPVRAQLERLAKDEGRSLSNMAAWIIQKFLGEGSDSGMDDETKRNDA